MKHADRVEGLHTNPAQCSQNVGFRQFISWKLWMNPGPILHWRRGLARRKYAIISSLLINPSLRENRHRDKQYKTYFIKKIQCYIILINAQYSLIFVQNTEGIKKGEVSCNVLKVFLRNVTIMVMVIIPKNRLSKDKEHRHQSQCLPLFFISKAKIEKWDIVGSPPPPSGCVY